MLERGVYLAPSQFEAAFVSAAHTDEDIGKTIAAATAGRGRAYPPAASTVYRGLNSGRWGSRLVAIQRSM
jgi:hypothetical protein